MSLLDQLIEFYYSFEDFHDEKLSRPAIRGIFDHLLIQDRIVHVEDSMGNLLGYCESWRLDYAQLGWVLCGEPFDVRKHDIVKGPIAYVSALTIHPDHRQGGVMQILRGKFLAQNYTAKYFTGERGKYSSPVRIHKREAYVDKYMESREVSPNGKV